MLSSEGGSGKNAPRKLKLAKTQAEGNEDVIMQSRPASRSRIPRLSKKENAPITERKMPGLPKKLMVVGQDIANLNDIGTRNAFNTTKSQAEQQ